MRKPAQEGRRRSAFARLVFSILAAIAMIATGGIVAAVHAPVAQAAQNLVCNASTFYTVRQNGELVQATVGSTTTKSIGTWANAGLPNANPNDKNPTPSVNGLGISAGGAFAYAFARYTQNDGTFFKPQWNSYVQILKYTASSGTSGTFAKVGSPYNVTTNGNATFANMIAGAIDPNSGDYFFGGYNGSDGSDNDGSFKLYRYRVTGVPGHDAGSIEYVGSITPKGQSSSGNGDIGFDKDGNLFLIYSTTRANQVVPVTRENLDNPKDGVITAQDAQPSVASAGSLQYNGIAFLSNGQIVVQAGSTRGSDIDTKVWTADGNTWKLTNETTLWTTGQTGVGTDLASCSYPPTIQAKKSITARVNSSDQFQMTIQKVGSSTVLGDATTTGSSTGLQDAVAGPAIAVSGNDYTITETGANGADLSKYQTTWTCAVDPGQDGWPKSGTGTTINVTSFPQPASDNTNGPNVTCTFTNSPKPVGPGAVQWTKVDAANTNTKLGGSEWKITGPSGSSSSDIAVKDCTSDNCFGTNDADHQAGQFEVQNLVPGQYTLTETKAPDGYALDSTPHDFTVTSGATASVSTAPLTNKKLEQAVCQANSPNLYNQLSTPDGSTDHIGATANKIQRYDVTNGQTTDLADLQSLGVTRETNGLGISADGRYFYVIDFNITSNPHIYQYDAQTGSVRTFNAANNGPNDNDKVRRGGVNLLNGIYYYSTTRQDGQGNVTNVNNLYALNPQTGQSWYVGAVNTRADAAGQSGDLAFDNQGNMYFVVGQNGYAYVYVYSGTLPQGPNSDPINITPQYLNAVGGTGNGVGIAYGGGNLYISNTAGNFYRVDPSTGATIPPDMTGVGGNGNTVDLATCTSPNTLTVKKDYPNGRGNADDNITLSAWRNTSTQVGQNVDTDGPATGVQTNQLGPVPILVGNENSYSVRETATNGGSKNLAAYDTSYSCTDTNDPTWPGKSGTIPSGDTQRGFDLGVIPAGGAQARAIVCTITNKPISGSVAWSKSGPDGTTLLSGSEWTLTGPGLPTDGKVVKDCISDNPCSTDPYTDQDTNSGAFKLDSLPFGSYVLTESTAPAGYIKITTPHTFTVDANHRVINLGVFTNPQQAPPALPLTGGMSTDAFIIGGAGLIVLSVATALIMRRRKAVHV